MHKNGEKSPKYPLKGVKKEEIWIVERKIFQNLSLQTHI